MLLPQLTLTELVETAQNIVTPQKDAPLVVLNNAQTEAVEFISRVARQVELVSHTYSSMDSKFKNKNSESFLGQVIISALLFQLIDITKTHSSESSVHSECHIGRQLLDLFQVKTLSDIPSEDVVTHLRCLAQFIKTLSKTSNPPIWFEGVPDSTVIELISLKIKNHPEWVVFNQQVTTIMTSVVNAVNTKVQEQKANDRNRLIVGRFLPYTVDPLIENSTGFIKNVAAYSAEPSTMAQISAAQRPSTKPMNVVSFLANVNKGAILLELIAIAAVSPKPEDQAKHLLGKAILDFLQVKQLADVEESTIVECLNCLDQFIQACPSTIRWNRMKTNDALREIISTELKKQPGWEMVDFNSDCVLNNPVNSTPFMVQPS